MKELVEHIKRNQDQLNELNWRQLTGGALIAANLLTGVPAADARTTIDAGHGGKKPGAVQQEYQEKNIVLQFAKVLNKYLPDAIMTRTGDSHIGLQTRSNIANKNKTDTFVSIHANSSTTAPAKAGVEVLYNTKSVKGKQLAQMVATAIGASRGIKGRTDLSVLNSTRMPAILIEIGFMNNKVDLQNMLDINWQNETAKKIAAAVKKFESQNEVTK